MNADFLIGFVTGCATGVLILMQIQVLSDRHDRKKRSESKVEWIGGPFDSHWFWAPASKTDVLIHLTESSGVRVPIEEIGGQRYAVWKDAWDAK